MEVLVATSLQDKIKWIVRDVSGHVWLIKNLCYMAYCVNKVVLRCSRSTHQFNPLAHESKTDCSTSSSGRMFLLFVFFYLYDVALPLWTVFMSVKIFLFFKIEALALGQQAQTDKEVMKWEVQDDNPFI